MPQKTDAVIAELMDRRLLNDVDPDLHQEIAKAVVKAVHTASLQGEDAVERVARTICQSGKFETGQGTCALICMDQLGDVRKKGCGHCMQVHGTMARAILATGLVPNKS